MTEPLTTHALVELYLLRCEVEGKSPRTVSAYRWVLSRFLQALEEDNAPIIATLEAEVPADVIAERTAVRVRVDGNGYADVRGERVRVGRTLAGAEVLFP